MKDEELIEFNVSNRVPPPVISPYEMLVRQSHKLGGVATKAFHEIGQILHHEVTFPHPNHLFERLRHTTLTGSRLGLRDDVQQFKETVKQSHQLLAKARTVFPLTLFPDSVIVDRTKVTIIKRDFFWSANVISFQIEDILNVSANVGPFFGSLVIASRVMSTVDHFYVNYLWRNDAMALKRIIQGYVIAKHSGIATDHLSQSELVDTLGELGIDSDK